MNIRNTGLGLAMLASLGCSSIVVEYSEINTPPHALKPVSPEKVEVFTTSVPANGYVEVGVLNGAHDSITSDADLIKAMKIEAGKRGCDALVITERNSVRQIASCLVKRVADG